MTVKVLSEDELKTMNKAGKAAALILKKLEKIIKPGITTKDIECFFEKSLRDFPEMEPAFKGFGGYPSSVCVSVNEEVIHGIPSEKMIKDGDVVSVDLGIKYKGFFVDTAYTYITGNIEDTCQLKLAKKLVAVSCDALYEGIKKVKVGARVGDIGSAIQQFVEGQGFSVIRKFVGHGIGRALHLPPEVPNFGRAGEGEELIEGMAIAIEPMVSAGGFEVDIMNDGWTAKTHDCSLSAHFEHTVAITKRGPWILSQ